MEAIGLWTCMEDVQVPMKTPVKTVVRCVIILAQYIQIYFIFLFQVTMLTPLKHLYNQIAPPPKILAILHIFASVHLTAFDYEGKVYQKNRTYT